MSIKLNDNIKINAGKPSESKYLSTGNTAYLSITDVNNQIPIAERYLGLTVLIDSGSTNLEHWYKEGVNDTDLIEKKFSSEQVIGDFITGATNLGFFSGRTGIQRLDLSGFPTSPVDFNGYYYSEYNNYYADAAGIITLGSPTYGGPLRRAYVDTTRTKSWIYDVSTSGWILSNNDVSANVGNSIVGYGYSGSSYTETEWIGFVSNGSTSVSAAGSLATGDTLTIGIPVYKNKSNQELHLRTIISDTPDFINVITDENFIRFSGVSSVLTASNYGGGIGVYSGQSNNNLNFRTLVQSGDTTITQNTNGEIIIYSSSEGSADAITGATNIGGGADIYSFTTGRTLNFNTLVGSGDTTVTQSTGGTVIIGSTGGAGGVFTEDITVSIASGKTFGRYENGDVIPASGKTPNEVILLSLAEPLEPTVNLNSSATDIDFGLTPKAVSLSFSYTINTVGAGVSSAVLEWRRGNTGSWSGLTSNTGDTSYAHSIDDSGNRFNTAVINYRYTVVDSQGATGQTTYNVTPQAYTAPTINPDYTPNLQSYETETLREVGNINTTIDGNITSNRGLVDLLEYRIQRDDGGGYVTIASASSINNLTTTISPYLDNSATSNATTINYRIIVEDEWTTTISSVYTINFRYSSYFGYNTNTSLSGAQIVALGNEELLSSRVRNESNVTAASLEYTYISYPASFGDLTNVIQNGASPVLGSFTKLSNVNVTNYYGESVNNILYKSVDPGAFDGDDLAFS